MADLSRTAETKGLEMTKSSEFTKKLKSGEPVLGLWMQIPHPVVAECLAQSTYDFILLDSEHSAVSGNHLINLLPAIELHDMPILYRVRWNTTELIKEALDHGVTGLMVPMINSVKEAEQAISASRYPPLGRRGLGAWRASNYYQKDAAYLAGANTNIPVILQIETKEAVASVEEIAALPGLDGLYIGPGDLAMSLGIQPGVMHPKLLEACEKVAAATKRNGLALGIDVASLDYVPIYRKMGFTLLTHGLDTSLLVDGSRSLLQSFRAAV